MKFDTIIIGGGLAGLTTGIRLAEKGKKCAIIATGQSSLYFSSGSFDLLNKLPNGELVISPSESLEQLSLLAPNHPYSKLGKDKFKTYANEAKKLLLNSDIDIEGTDNINHYRLSPIGTLAPTWLTIRGLASFESDSIRWKEVLIVTPEDYLDLMHRFVSKEFCKLNIDTTVKTFNLSDLEAIKNNPTEFRSENIARLFDEKPHLIKDLAQKIKQFTNKNYDAILLPTCFSNFKTLELLRTEAGIQNIYLLPTMPPSVPGIEVEKKLKQRFKKLGGTLFTGDTVKSGLIENNSLKKIFTRNHEEVPFIADDFVLASGSFFSRGLFATPTKVIEPIFNLDIDAMEKREDWYNDDLYDTHNYLQFGIKTTKDFLVSKGGKIIDNIYAIGAVLSNYQPIDEGCGAGVAMLTGIEVANNILSKNKVEYGN